MANGPAKSPPTYRPLNNADLFPPEKRTIVSTLVRVTFHPTREAVVLELKDLPITLLYGLSLDRARELQPLFRKWISEGIPIRWTFDPRTRHLFEAIPIVDLSPPSPPCALL